MTVFVACMLECLLCDDEYEALFLSFPSVVQAGGGGWWALLCVCGGPYCYVGASGLANAHAHRVHESHVKRLCRFIYMQKNTFTSILSYRGTTLFFCPKELVIHLQFAYLQKNLHIEVCTVRVKKSKRR